MNQTSPVPDSGRRIQMYKAKGQVCVQVVAFLQCWAKVNMCAKGYILVTIRPACLLSVLILTKAFDLAGQVFSNRSRLAALVPCCAAPASSSDVV